MQDEFKQASDLERSKMEQFLPIFTQPFLNFKYQFSNSDGYDCQDVLMIINGTKCVGEIKCRYKHYDNGYYLEVKKHNRLKAKFPDKKLLYICISVTGVYVYNLNKIDFSTIPFSYRWLPATSAKKSKLVYKPVYTLPIDKEYCKYYPLLLV